MAFAQSGFAQSGFAQGGTTTCFDPAAFDSAYFDVCVSPTTSGGGHAKATPAQLRRIRQQYQIASRPHVDPLDELWLLGLIDYPTVRMN